MSDGRRLDPAGALESGDRGRSAVAWRWSLDDFHSADEPMRRCLELARLAARTDLPVLVLGETGTGKTLLARAIHNSSRRANGAFVAFNAAALSDTLLDSQLFGHERGAFTGADRRVKGKFAQAHRGTLFVDEIADMTEAAQAKILRAIEYGEFEPLGADALQVADVRVISATHWPMRQLLQAGGLRRDLFYRVSGLTLTVPPLRERPADLRALIAAEVRSSARSQGKTVTGFQRGALDRLLAHRWPGNLRELCRVIPSAVALSPDGTISETVIAMLLEGHEEAIAAEGRDGPQANGDRRLRAVEQAHIRTVLDQVGGNKRQAARLLGVSRSTLDRRLRA